MIPAFSALASEITAENVVFLVNEERGKVGLEGLARNGILDKVALNKAQDMLKNDYFAHTSPSGTTPWYWFGKEGYEYEYAGENLAINFVTAEKQNESWMNSETHRKNILSDKFREIGVAVIRGEVNGRSAIITVQEFGSRTGTKRAAGQEPEKVLGQIESEKKTASAVSSEDNNNAAGTASMAEKYERNLKKMKAFAVVSVFVMALMLFASFIHRIVEVSSGISKHPNKFFSIMRMDQDRHARCQKIIVRFFPMDMKKVEVTHLDHMKQRE